MCFDFFFNDTATTEIYTLSLHDALPILTLSVDSSGEALHRRGWRQEVGRAPLRETLAAAVLLAARWGGTPPLVDPLCGDRKSTRLKSRHANISYAVFFFKKKKKTNILQI